MILLQEFKSDCPAPGVKGDCQDPQVTAAERNRHARKSRNPAPLRFLPPGPAGMRWYYPAQSASLSGQWIPAFTGMAELDEA